jgi:glycosyltransferase involved in cell wall biosynthesis
MSARKKLLILTPRFPYPVIGGDRLRIYFLCKELSKSYDLTLLSLCESREELNMPLPDDGVFTKVERVLLPRWRSYFNCILALPTSTPLQVAYYKSSLFKEKFDDLIVDQNMVLAHLVRSCSYLFDTDLPKVIEMTDAISLNYKRVKTIAKSGGIKNLIYSIEQSRLEKFEKTAIEKSDLSIFVSSIDKDYLLPDENDSLRDRVVVCSNGVDLETMPFDYKPDGQTIVFIGSMSTVQNLDAARWFANEVMPVLKAHGSFTFKIVGRIGKSNFDEFNNIDGVLATGIVDSVADAVKGAFAGVCPMRLGAGVQNKILEYMALGLPAITSKLGHEGIDAVEGKQLLVADTVGEYVKHLVALSSNRVMADKLSSNGREFIINNHSWSSMLKPLVLKIDKLIK